MANTRGVFGLLDIRSRIRKNTWVPPEEVWLNDPIPNTGYFGGGSVGTPRHSTMDKVSYSSDTTAAVPGANLSSARQGLAATGNSTSGYFGGGLTPTAATMDKVSYSTDTRSTVPGAALSVARQGLAATGNSTFGYFGGGIDNVPTPDLLYSTMDKVTYSTDTTAAVPGAALSAARYGVGATGNSTEGYFGGGAPGPRSTMDKVTYSTDTRSTVPGAALSVARTQVAATGNSTAGYFGGGLVSPNFYSTMDKIDYATDTRVTAIPGLNLSVARERLAASSLRANGLPSTPIANTTTGRNFISQGTSFNTGYFGGGGVPGTSTAMDKVTYASDTTAAVPGAALSVARDRLAATGNSTSGYFGGGNDGTNLRSTMDKVSYSSDTTAAVPGAFLTVARQSLAATGNSTAGYFGGGNLVPGASSTTDKITYSTDTTAAVPGAALSVAREQLAATGNSTAGYFGGGVNTVPNPDLLYSSMDKITYSSDTTAAVPGAALSAARYEFAATGSSTAGYFGGGATTGPVRYSTVDKVTYASDTTAAVPGANLTVARERLAATGNSTSGYFGGGIAPLYSTMDKVSYSTDTTVAVPGAALSVARRYLAASSSTANALIQQEFTATPQALQGNTGYFGGGDSGGPSGLRSTMDKVTYSTDTTAAVPGAALSAARAQLAATGNSSAGYFGGGVDTAPTPPNPDLLYSTMDKVTYSTDTTAAVPGAFLTVARGGVAATGNSTAGYFGAGGGAPGPSNVVYSTMDKVTYSTDTTAAVPGAALSVARAQLAATGNSTTGYFGGGIDIVPAPDLLYSTMDKITYSTDTTAAVPGAALSAARYGAGATGNSTAGYFGGGAVGIPVRSTMDKVTYSTDTTAAVPGAALSAARYGAGATGNSIAGYFGGGLTPTAATMDKVSYSTDTRSTVPGAALSVARGNLAASSSTANAVRGTVPQVPIV